MDSVKLLIAIDGRTKRAAPHDVRGKVPVREIGVVLVPAGLEFLDQACDCVSRFMRLSSSHAQCRTIRLMLIIHGYPPFLCFARKRQNGLTRMERAGKP